jgi:diketogulonate reductase-like aldo/keto reductase
MIIPTKKLQSGFEIPVFGLGTWMMGGDRLRNPQNNDQADITAIKNAIEAGITHIDTAESYAEGHAETLVGEAIKGYDRKKLFIVSKAKKENHAYDDLLNSAKASLERLGTEYLNLYLLHAPSHVVPIEETMKAMDYLVEKGLVRHLGVSNFTVPQMKRAQEVTKNKIVANQLHLNLMYRETEKAGLIEYCQQNDVMFIAWRPLQKGVLLEGGKEILEQFAKKYDKTPAQIAINWLISQKNLVTLSKIADTAHLQEDLGAIGWAMSQEDIASLSKNFPNQQFISDAVPLKEWS